MKITSFPAGLLCSSALLAASPSPTRPTAADVERELTATYFHWFPEMATYYNLHSCRESVGVSQGRAIINELGATNETTTGASLSLRGTSLYSSHGTWHWPTLLGISPRRVSYRVKPGSTRRKRPMPRRCIWRASGDSVQSGHRPMRKAGQKEPLATGGFRDSSCDPRRPAPADTDAVPGAVAHAMRHARAARW